MKLLRLFVLLAVVLGLASCKKAAANDTLLVAGSTTLDTYLDPVVAGFVKKNPKISVIAEPGGTTAGVIAVKRGAIDIAGLARDVSAKEDDLDLRDYLIARDGVAIIVHSTNPVANLTVSQVAKIVTGEVANWKDVGGPDQPLVLLSRNKDARTRKSLVDLVLGGDDSLRGKELATGKEVDAAVKADPKAVGFVALKDLAKDAKSVSIDGVPFSRSTMLSGRYPLTRSFYLAVYRKATPAADKFIEYTLSKEGQELLEADGLLGVY